MDLNSAVREYQEGLTSWETLVEQMIPFMDRVLRRQQRRRLMEDQRWDIITGMYPRLQRLVDCYEDQGSTFEAYMGTCVRHAYRAYLRTEARRQDRCTFLDARMEDSRHPGLMVEEVPDPVGGTYQPDFRYLCGEGTTPERLRRQLLISFCRNIPILSVADCQRYANILALPQTWVEAVAMYAQHHRTDRTKRRTWMRERRNHHISRMMSCLASLNREEDREARRQLADQYTTHRRYWLRQIEQLRRQTYHLTSREVAILLGIPKGSVDSSLYQLTRTLASCKSKGYPRRHDSTSRFKQPAQAARNGWDNSADQQHPGCPAGRAAPVGNSAAS